MSTENINIDFSFQYTLKYPFQGSDITPDYNDPCGRAIERLLASFSIYGNGLLNRNFAGVNFNTDHFQSVLRMCNDSMLPDDFVTFANRLPISHLSQIIKPSQELTSSLEETRKRQQVIIAHFTTETRWLVFLVSLITGHVDIYTVGDVASESIVQFATQVHQSLNKVFHGKKFKFKMRLAFPLGFIKDPALAAFLISLHLHNHGKYLNMTELDVMKHKFSFVHEFLKYHDNWLGGLNLAEISTKSHPFYVQYRGNDNLELLQKKGWEIVDVDGDGNCGYYAFELGLESHGIFTYKPIQDSKATTMRRNRPWQSAILRLRKDLRERSDKLLTEKVNVKTPDEPAWWIHVAPTPHEKNMFDGDTTETNDANLSQETQEPDQNQETQGPDQSLLQLSESLYSDDIQNYYGGSLEVSDQMDCIWGPLVFVSLFNIRVVCICRHLSLEKRKLKIGFTTHIFDQKTPIDSSLPEHESPHLVHEFKEHLYRIPDEEFNEKATIEIVYICDDSSGIAHFLFLRRVLCDDTPLASLNRPVSLRDVLKRESRFPLHIASPQPNPKKRKKSDSTIEKQSPDKRRKTTKSFSKQDRGEPAKNSASILESVVEQVETPERNQFADRRKKDVPRQQEMEVAQAVDSIVDENEPNLDAVGQVETSEGNQQRMESDRAIEPAVEATLDSVDEQSGENEPTRHSEGQVETSEGNQQRLESDRAIEPAVEATLDSAVELSGENEPTRHSEGQVETSERAIDPSIDGTNSEVTEDSAREQDREDPAIEDINTRQVSRKQPTLRSRGKSFPQTRKSPRKKTDAQTSACDEDSLEQLENFFDESYENQSLKHKTAARMFYDNRRGIYMVRHYDFGQKKYRAPVRCFNPDLEFDESLVTNARKHASIWVGCSVGDARDDCFPPKDVTTKVPLLYPQHNESYCLTHSLASALFYCGFKEEASILVSQDKIFSTFHFDEAISNLLGLMENLVPTIGRATIFGRRTKTHDRKLRELSFDSLYKNLTPYPTLIIPVTSDGLMSHAICAVDDLLFDSIASCALKLNEESLKWIFNGAEVKIHHAFRFCEKILPPNSKGEFCAYSRKVHLHWESPSRIGSLVSSDEQTETICVANQPVLVPENHLSNFETAYHHPSDRYSLVYSLASALHYCGYRAQAFQLASRVVQISAMLFGEAIAEILDFMSKSVQEIGRPTIYQKQSKKRKRRRGCLTFESILSDLDPHPTIIIPVLSHTGLSHPFCVIDDLVFDSVYPFALRLQRDTFNWMFQEQEIKIHKAYRFSNKSTMHQNI